MRRNACRVWPSDSGEPALHISALSDGEWTPADVSHDRLAGSRLPIGNPVAVQLKKLHLANVDQSSSNGVPGWWHNVVTIAPGPSRQQGVAGGSSQLIGS